MSLAAAKAAIDEIDQRGVIGYIPKVGLWLIDKYSRIANEMNTQHITRMIGFDSWPEYLFLIWLRNHPYPFNPCFVRKLAPWNSKPPWPVYLDTLHNRRY